MKTGSDDSCRFSALEIGTYTEQIAAAGFKMADLSPTAPYIE